MSSSNWRLLRDPYVRTEQSLNKMAGIGLFANTAFKRGDMVATLAGPLVRDDQLSPIEVLYAVGGVAKKVVSDGIAYDMAINTMHPDVQTLGHRANSPFGDPLGRTANVRFAPDRAAKIVRLRALRPIAADEEILVDYGEERTEKLRLAIADSERLSQAKRRASDLSGSEASEEQTRKLRRTLAAQPVVPRRRIEAPPFHVPLRVDFDNESSDMGESSEMFYGEDSTEELAPTEIVPDDDLAPTEIVPDDDESVIILGEESASDVVIINRPTREPRLSKSDATTSDDDSSF
jgi:hypothetical protein